MIKNIFKEEPIDIIDIVDNERFLYYELIALKKEVKKNRKEFEKEKSKYNQVFGMVVKLQKEGPFNVGFDEGVKCVRDKIKELREIDNIDLIQFKIKELLEYIEEFLRRVTNE